MPPLRERKSDVLLLADHSFEKYAREHGKRIKRISTPAIDMLTSYHWPGNVRELRTSWSARADLRNARDPRASFTADVANCRRLKDGYSPVAGSGGRSLSAI